MQLPISARQQMLRETKARTDPLSFVTDEYFMGRKPYPMQAELFSTFYSDPKIMLMVILAGMRGGKTRLAADILCYEIYDLLTTDDIAAKYMLEEGSKFYLTCIASSAEQAEDTIFHEVKKSIKKAQFFDKFDPKIYTNEVRFDDYDIEVKAGISSAMGLVGRTVKCNVFDELSKLEKTEGKRSADMVYSLLSKSTSSFQFAGKNIVITSPMHTEDRATRLYNENLHSPYALCRNVPTWEMNPNLPFDGEYMQARLIEDPITFWRDFGAVPQSALDKFFKDEEILKFDHTLGNVLESSIAWNALVLNQRRNPVTLVCAGDPSARRDSFGVALGYLGRDYEYRIIGLKRYEPEVVDHVSSGSDILDDLKPKMEVNPLDVRKDILRIRTDLGCKHFVFDTWNYPLLQNELEHKYRSQVYNNVVRIDHYESVRKLFYAEKLHVTPHDVVMEEWKKLIQINARKVDHPKLGSKDLADAICNVIFVLDEIPIVIRAPAMIRMF